MPNHNKEEIAVDEDQLLEVNDAVKYLAERWGMESYSLDAFRIPAGVTISSLLYRLERQRFGAKAI
jgi:hypothetical protein